MNTLLAVIFTFVICGLFMRWVLANQAIPAHNNPCDCNQHEWEYTYFPEGLFCCNCGKDLKDKLNNHPNHDCDNHQMYFEGPDSRGLYCNICHKLLSEEPYPKRN